jgi:WhiB family transcriptional regulator, redox-sensing transcriptional regulator
MARRRIAIIVCDVCGDKIADGTGRSRSAISAGANHVADLCRVHEPPPGAVVDRPKMPVHTDKTIGAHGRHRTVGTTGNEPASPPGDGPWTPADSRCRNAPAELFFPLPGDDPGPAKAICARCPALARCRIHALGLPNLEGIWGGLTEPERHAERQRLEGEQAGGTLPPGGPDTAPPRGTSSARGSLMRTLEELTGHPLRWARIVHWQSPETAGAVASTLRTGRRPVPGGGSWQFQARLNDGGGSDLYAHFRPTRAGAR